MSNVHSIYGKMVGYRFSDGEILSYNPSADAVQSHGTVGQAVITAATTAGTTLKPWGTNTLGGSTTHDYTLPTPAGKGRIMSIVSITASTAQTVTCSSANGQILTTGGSSVGYVAFFKGLGANVTLREGSTVWYLIGVSRTTDSVHFTS